MSEPFIGEIRIMPYTYAPEGWARCDGQLLPIAENTALFSILGTMYGGDGRVNFAIPNLQGRAPMHPGTGPGLTPRALARTGGYSEVPLTESQIPRHKHVVNAMTSNIENKLGTNNSLGVLTTSQRGRVLQKEAYSTTPGTDQMSHEAVSSCGHSDRHENRQPYIGVNFCIALEGMYPPRS